MATDERDGKRRKAGKNQTLKIKGIWNNLSFILQITESKAWVTWLFPGSAIERILAFFSSFFLSFLPSRTLHESN